MEMSVEIFLLPLIFGDFFKTRGCMMIFLKQTRVRMRGAALQSALQWRGTIIMGMNQSSGGEPRPAAIEKKPYEKPTFRYEQVFVTSALSCGKIASEGACHLNSKVS